MIDRILLDVKDTIFFIAIYFFIATKLIFLFIDVFKNHRIYVVFNRILPENINLSLYKKTKSRVPTMYTFIFAY